MILNRFCHSVGHCPSNVLEHLVAVILLDRLLCCVGHNPTDVLGHPADVLLDRHISVDHHPLYVHIGNIVQVLCAILATARFGRIQNFLKIQGLIVSLFSI